MPPRVYADFQHLDDSHLLRLTRAGTAADLERLCLRLREGLALTISTDDAGHPDEVRAEGVVHSDDERRWWVAAIDWSALRHAPEGWARGRPGLIGLS